MSTLKTINVIHPSGTTTNIVNDNLGGVAVGANLSVAGTTTLATALGVASGGTGLSSTPTSGQIDIGNGTGFTRATLTAGSGISITYPTAGAISIAATGGGATGISNGTSNVNIASANGAVTITTAGTLAMTMDTSQNAAFAGSLTSAIHYGGTGAASTLTLQSTSGVGTSDSMLFKVGNNGATTAITISTAGLVTANNLGSSSAAITGGAINGTTVGASTASTGAFTTLSASSTVSGAGFSTYLASPPAIGGTAAAAGAFTTLSASSTVSGTGFSTYLASPPAIGGTAAAAGAFTTLSASSTVSGTGFSTYLASPPAIGGTAAAAGSFTTLVDSIGNVRNVPQNAQTAAYVLVASDNGKHIAITTGGVTVNASIFSAGQSVTVYNNSASSQTITQGTSVTMYLVGTATTGNRTLAQRGLCTIFCVASNTFVITGGGLT